MISEQQFEAAIAVVSSREPQGYPDSYGSTYPTDSSVRANARATIEAYLSQQREAAGALARGREGTPDSVTVAGIVLAGLPGHGLTAAGPDGWKASYARQPDGWHRLRVTDGSGAVVAEDEVGSMAEADALLAPFRDRFPD